MDGWLPVCSQLQRPEIQEHMKEILHYQVSFIPEMQEMYNIQKSINIIHHVNKMKEKTV